MSKLFLIAQRYPSAAFEVARGEDPEGVYLRTTVDIEDVDEVLDFVLDPLFTYQVEQGMPIYVLPLQPVDRVLRESQRPHPRKRLRTLPAGAAPVPLPTQSERHNDEAYLVIGQTELRFHPGEPLFLIPVELGEDLPDELKQPPLASLSSPP